MKDALANEKKDNSLKMQDNFGMKFPEIEALIQGINKSCKISNRKLNVANGINRDKIINI